MTEIVRFSAAPAVFEAAAALFTAVNAELGALMPYAEIEHVGSTAVHGTLTKGDLDIVIRVPADRFADALRVLEPRFARNTGSIRTDTFCAFEDAASNPPLGVQLVTVGAPEDFFLTWRALLESDSQLRRDYDDLKRRFDGKPMEAYRAAKSEFIEARLKRL